MNHLLRRHNPPSVAIQRFFASLNGNAVKVGHVLELEEGLYKVTKSTIVKPGKGGAFNNLDLVNVLTSRKLTKRLRSSETVHRASFSPAVDYDVLYTDGGQVHLMQGESYEQISVGVEVVEERLRPYLVDGVTLSVTFYEGKPVIVDLPKLVTVGVEEADGKSARLENGVVLQVPPHVKGGEKVTVNMETGEYHGRVKE
mmetsp:Transcript_14265/g.28421  ORF Transcript_14265/g.28421 Transcript_14265/m.28421 type:complete len:199 (+) Transcript_14265:41-637(+)